MPCGRGLTFRVALCRARPYEKVRDQGALGYSSCGKQPRILTLHPYSEPLQSVVQPIMRFGSTTKVLARRMQKYHSKILMGSQVMPAIDCFLYEGHGRCSCCAPTAKVSPSFCGALVAQRSHLVHNMHRWSAGTATLCCISRSGCMCESPTAHLSVKNSIHFLYMLYIARREVG